MDPAFIQPGSTALVRLGADLARPNRTYRLEITKVHLLADYAGRAHVTGLLVTWNGKDSPRKPRKQHAILSYAKCQRADLVLRWAGEAPQPGRLCIRCGNSAPAGRTFEDQHGWLWCADCADHITTCDDTRCDHRGGMWLNEEAALRAAVRDFRPSKINAAFTLIRQGRIEATGIGSAYRVRGSHGDQYQADPYACDCPDARLDNNACKHRAAVLMLEARAKQVA